MYAKYVYQAGATQQNIVDDLVLILTGTTDKALLSTGAGMAAPDVTANEATYIDVSVRPAGWTKHSLTYSQNDNLAVMLKAPWDDSNIYNKDPGTVNALQYKFCEVVSPDSTMIGLKTCEYSTTAKPAVKTNVAGVNFVLQRINLTTGGYVLISSSNRHAAMFSFNGTEYGSSSAYPRHGFNAVFERTRMSPWDTNLKGYPPSVAIGSRYTNGSYGQCLFENYSVCRFKYPNGNDGTINNSGFYHTSSYVSHNWFTTCGVTSGLPANNTVLKDSTGASVHCVYPIGISARDQMSGLGGVVAGMISEFADIWFTTTNFGAAEDIVPINGNDYVIWTSNVASGTGSGERFAVRKG